MQFSMEDSYGDDRILTHPAHRPDTARPLRIGEFGLYVNPNPTVGNGTNQNNKFVIHQDLRVFITTYPR